MVPFCRESCRTNITNILYIRLVGIPSGCINTQRTNQKCVTFLRCGLCLRNWHFYQIEAIYLWKCDELSADINKRYIDYPWLLVKKGCDSDDNLTSIIRIHVGRMRRRCIPVSDKLSGYFLISNIIIARIWRTLEDFHVKQLCVWIKIIKEDTLQ